MRGLTLTLLPVLAAGPASAGDLEVVTDLPIVAAMVEEIGGEAVKARAIFTAGDTHAAALRPSEATALSEADLVVWIGPSLNASFARTVEALGPDRQIRLLDVPGTSQIEIGKDDGHEHGHDHGHGRGAVDPHAWLDPENVVVWNGAIADTLRGLGVTPDPTQLSETSSSIRAAADELSDRLSATSPRFGVAHDALAYFSDAFGVSPVATLADSSAQFPGPRRVAEATDAMAQGGADCLLVEMGHATALPAAVAERLELPLVEVDLTGRDLEPGSTYVDFIIALGDALIDGCAPGA